MKQILNLIFFVVPFLIQTLAFSASPLPASEVTEIRNFTSLSLKKGPLLNPPRGVALPQVLAIRDYVKKIVEDLAGADIKSRDIHYVVNVYANNSMNAWVMQMDPEDGAESKWKKNNPGKIWPLRKAWGFPDDNKPIYELGVTTTLLRRLSTKDELAFILGHELTHLLEGHTDHGDNETADFKKWWSSQSHEAVADHLGIDKILGKYELDAALSVMDKLHPKSDDTLSLSDAMEAGAGTHHAEGVRISALQFYIEYLRRFNLKATPRVRTEIPQALKLDIWGRSQKPSIEGDPSALKAYMEYIDKILDGKVNPKDAYQEDDDYKAGAEFSKSAMGKLFGEDEEKSFADLMVKTVEKINRSQASKAQKINAFLQCMVFVGSRITSYYQGNKLWFDGLTLETRWTLSEFLVKNASGENPWTVNDFKQLMSQWPLDSRKFIESPFLGNEVGIKLFTNVVKAAPAWQQFVSYMTSMESFTQRNLVHTIELGGLLSNLQDGEFPESPLKETYRKNILNSLSQYPHTDLLLTQLDKGGISGFNYIAEMSSEKDVSLWATQVKEAIRPHMALYKKNIFKQLMVVLAKKTKTIYEDTTVTFGLARLKVNELSPTELTSFMKAYEKNIQSVINPVRDLNSIDITRMMMKEAFQIALEFMAFHASDRKRTLDTLRYILISTEPRYFLNRKTLSQKTQDQMSQILKSMSKEEFWYISETLSSSEQEIWEEVKVAQKKYKFSSGSDLLTKVMTLPDAEGKDLADKSFSWSRELKMNARVQQNLLQLFNQWSDTGSLATKEFKIAELKRLLKNIEVANYMKQFNGFGGLELGMPQAAAKALFEIFYQQIGSFSNWQDLVHTYERMTKASGAGFIPDLEQEKRLSLIFQEKMKSMSLQDQLQWLQRESLRKALGSEFVGRQLAAYVHQTVGTQRARLKNETSRVLKLIPLQEKWPDAFSIFRNSLAELQKVQPAELAKIFPEDSRSLTEKSEIGVNLIRGMSAFSVYVRTLSMDEQVEMIEFITGRSSTMPKSLNVPPDRRVTDAVDNKQFFLKMREEMKFRSVIERAMVINSILTGPNSMLAKEEGLKKVHQHLLKSVSSDNREMAETILKALSDAEKGNKSLILSYALSQKSEAASGEGPLTEALVLRSLLDSYGVPGVKLAQYLAFTSEFKNFQSALEVYQDAAMPISYYEALLLIQKRMGANWDPSLYRVNKLLGSGSVNIAIEYENLKTGKAEVVSLSRDEIEVKTKEDFRRFQLLLKELTKTDAQKKKFDFIIGLMELIQKSVTLEFDKPHSFKMQKSVKNLYSQKVDGWNIQTIDAYAVKDMALFMEKAPGSGARKILKNDPATYESAMRAFMKVEYGILRGVDQTQNWNPVPLHANPDLHDGQVMIDVNNRTVTILDFGQAVEISNQEREFALDLLRIISKVESVPSAMGLIQKYSMAMQNKKIDLKSADFVSALNRSDRMDVFVHLLSSVSRAGFDVPLSTVHWVLAANRLIKLGEKVRLSPESSIKWLLGLRKVGLPLVTFNAGKAIADKIKGVLSPTKQMLPAPRCSAIFSF